MSTLVTFIDSQFEVVSVRRADVILFTTRDADNDGYLFLDLDKDLNVMGVCLTAANQMPPEYWAKHPDRNLIPSDILAKMDEIIPTVYGRG